MLGWIRPGSFLLLSAARAGTTLLVDYLNCHPRIRCHREILGEDHAFYGEPWSMGHDRLKLHFESFFVKRPGTLKGAKILTYHLDELPIKLTNLIEILDRPKILVLYRQNVLEQYVSLKMAERDGLWHVVEQTKSLPIRIDPHDFLAEIRMWRDNLAVLGECGVHYLTYEQLIRQNRSATADVFDFLGLEPCAIQSRYVKQHPEPLAKRLVNYREVVRHGIWPDELLQLPFPNALPALLAA